jgi:quercetin dioxygenase-like cupin family protein
MVKSRIDASGRPLVSPSLVLCVLISLCRPLASAAAAPAPSAPSLGHVYSGVRTVLSTGDTVTGEPIVYPSGAPAKLTALEITLEPGQLTGWHTHPVPLFGYILEGELTVDYGAKGQRVYRKGDGLAEAMHEAHNGRNLGQTPVTILAVFIGEEGVQISVPAQASGSAVVTNHPADIRKNRRRAERSDARHLSAPNRGLPRAENGFREGPTHPTFSSIRDRHLVDLASLPIDDQDEPAGPVPTGHRGAVFEVACERHSVREGGRVARQIGAFVIVEHLFAVGELKIVKRHARAPWADERRGRWTMP